MCKTWYLDVIDSSACCSSCNWITLIWLFDLKAVGASTLKQRQTKIPPTRLTNWQARPKLTPDWNTWELDTNSWRNSTMNILLAWKLTIGENFDCSCSSQLRLWEVASCLVTDTHLKYKHTISDRHINTQTD